MTTTAQERAEKSAAAMWANDDASKWLGMELVSVGPGTAVVRLKVAKHHTNGHDNCHGGIIYALADSAFAFACNSYNKITVAHHNSITYLVPGTLGDTLTATAQEISVAGRSGIYDVSVTRDDGTVIAQFRGGSRIIKGTHFEEPQ